MKMVHVYNMASIKIEKGGRTEMFVIQANYE